MRPIEELILFSRVVFLERLLDAQGMNVGLSLLYIVAAARL